MTKTTRLMMLLASTAGVTLAASPSLSQTVQTPPPQTAPQATDTNSVGEVVVTAQRRKERVQDVPIAISVVSGDTLKVNNLNSLNDLQQISSSVVYNENGTAFEIRGVGTVTQNGSAESDVAVVVDDVVQGVPEIDHGYPYYNALTDIDRIEVLKGPQGTLFGKNSSAGVLNIVTKRPVLGSFGDEASLSYGTLNEVKVSDTLNIPITSTLAARVSAYRNSEDGRGYNAYSDQRVGSYYQEGVDAKLLWKPNEQFSAYVILEDRRSKTNQGGASSFRSYGDGNGSFQPSVLDSAYGVVPSATNTKIATDGSNLARSQKDGGSVHLDYVFPGDITLSSITAYYNTGELSNIDVDYTPSKYLSHFFEPFHGHQFTQEFRLTSPSDQFLEYTLGAFYYNVFEIQDVQLYGTLGLEPESSASLLGVYGPGEFHNKNSTTSYAGFGQVTLHFTDKFRVFGGLRGTHDHLEASQSVFQGQGVCQLTYAFGAPCVAPTYQGYATIPNGTPFSYPTIPSTGTTSASNLSGKIGVQYDVTHNFMAYGTVATGYKGPATGFDPQEAVGSVFTPIRPETSDDYEAGIKSQWFNRRLTINLAGFYTLYKDFQAQYYLYVPNHPELNQAVVGNAGALETKGAEADTSFIINRDFSVSGGMTFAPARYKSFYISCSALVTNTGGPSYQLVNPPTVGGYPGGCVAPAGAPAGTALTQFNAAGYPLANAPDLVYTLAGDYHHTYAGYLVTGHVSWVHRSSTYTLTANPNTIQDGYGILTASIGVGPANGAWRVSLFGRNLLNQNYVDAILPSFYDNGQNTRNPFPVQGYTQVFDQNAIRTVGIKLEAKF